MLGTITLIGSVLAGAFGVTAWIIIPLSLVNTLIGMHAFPGKADMLRGRGIYWQVFWSSLPLQAALTAVLFGAGYLGRWAFS